MGFMKLKNILKDNPRFSPLEKLERLSELYDFLKCGASIGAMISATEAGKPAVTGIIKQLETRFHDKKSSGGGMNFQKNVFLKQFVGYLISHIMNVQGYMRDRNKNISALKSKYFRAGTVYKKLPSIKDEKKIARAFWKKYDAGNKTLSVFNNLPQLVLQGGLDFQTAGYRCLKNTSFEYWPHLQIIKSYYADRLFLMPMQIAAELERRYPGIIAVSGLELNGDLEAEEVYTFMSIFTDIFPGWSENEDKPVETAELSCHFLPQAAFYMDTGEAATLAVPQYIENKDSAAADKDNDYDEYEADYEPVTLIRLNSSDMCNTGEAKALFSKSNYSWDKNIFDSLSLLELCRQALDKLSCGNDSGRAGYATAHQIAFMVSELSNDLRFELMAPLIYRELARRIWTGEIRDLTVEFIYGLHITALAYELGDVTGLSEFIPIFRKK